MSEKTPEVVIVLKNGTLTHVMADQPINAYAIDYDDHGPLVLPSHRDLTARAYGHKVASFADPHRTQVLIQAIHDDGVPPDSNGDSAEHE